MIVALAPIVVCIVGLFAYALSSNPKAAECGRLAFFAGLLVAVSIAAHQTMHLP